jgi:hypothetical protein
MRRMWAVGTSLAVLLMFLAAPFLHLHQNSPHEHGGAGAHSHEAILHAHLPQGDSPNHEQDAAGTGLSHASHEAKPASLVAVLEANSAPALPPGSYLGSRVQPAPQPVVMARMIPDDQPSAHDPPSLDLTSPRAPPA